MATGKTKAMRPQLFVESVIILFPACMVRKKTSLKALYHSFQGIPINPFQNSFISLLFYFLKISYCCVGNIFIQEQMYIKKNG